ncbi:hypothetical protein C8J57DRAFT_1628220 [Mycena rebaudengoi]|nr:hypothetical protein C8J57DRAFT_1628220 [Mycena rebaudengoi]
MNSRRALWMLAIPPPASDAVNPADCILRSSDGVDFHVHKAILSFESIFFRDIFSLPEPVEEHTNLVRDGKPVVTLDESSQTVRKLLVLCYPRYASDELVSNLDGVDDAYVAADKYMVTRGQDLIEKLLADPRILENHPHRVYAIAIHRGMDTLVKIAAKETLKWPIHVSRPPSVPEFKVISAQNLLQLQAFHRICVRWTVRAIENSRIRFGEGNFDLSDYVWWTETDHSEGCGASFRDVNHEEAGYVGTDAVSAEWFNEHMKKVESILETRPDAASIPSLVCKFTSTLVASFTACPKCADRAPDDLVFAATMLSREVAQSQEKIPSIFSFND